MKSTYTPTARELLTSFLASVGVELEVMSMTIEGKATTAIKIRDYQTLDQGIFALPGQMESVLKITIDGVKTRNFFLSLPRETLDDIIPLLPKLKAATVNVLLTFERRFGSKGVTLNEAYSELSQLKAPIQALHWEEINLKQYLEDTIGFAAGLEFFDSNKHAANAIDTTRSLLASVMSAGVKPRPSGRDISQL